MMLIFEVVFILFSRVMMIGKKDSCFVEAKAIYAIEPMVALNRLIASNARKSGECRMASLVNLECCSMWNETGPRY